MKLRADLHIHSNYSFDSTLNVKAILKKAKKEKLDIIAITDHEKFEGAILAEKLSKDIIIIKGEEIDTEYGDIIGLFLEKEIRTQKFSEVIKEIRRQNGIVVIPHPAVHHILSEKVTTKADLIEVFNSRVGSASNNMAVKLASDLGVIGIAGSDAHFLFEIGNGVTMINSKSRKLEDIKQALLNGDVQLRCKTAPSYKRYLAKIVKLWRRR